MASKRSEVTKESRWNVEPMYADLPSWQKQFDEIKGSDAHSCLKELASLKGTLQRGPEAVLNLLTKLIRASRTLEKLYTWAHLRHDEEITLNEHKEAFNRITALLHDLKKETSWFEPELLSLPEETLKTYLQSPVLKDYRYVLEKIIRMKPHTLSHEQEELIALAGKAFQAPPKAFSAMNNADFKFGCIADSQGEQKELTHASYSLFIRDQDRTLRENAFKTFYGKYQDFQNTLCELLAGRVQQHVFNAKARHYKSSLDAALFPKDVPVAVYRSLIQAVRSKISVLHDYMKLRKSVLNVDKLHMWDLYVPLLPNREIHIEYAEGEKLVIESVAPLGEEYQNLLQEGLVKNRWVDRYENENKRSGAYSSGCYDSMPYILMNYKGLLRDVSTLAHEAGHSMHSLLSRTHQPYHYSEYTIFEAEVASTFNEDLLNRLLLQRAQSAKEKAFLLNEQIEDMRGTLFRQTMFAEFELQIHEWAEEDRPLTPDLLKNYYLELLRFYFGPEVELDSPIEIEWARIPHFYYNFYVFQYATGISAAIALAEKVVTGGTAEREAYLNFLKSGCSKFPIELLKVAGVDMSATQPVEAALGKFAHLVSQLREIVT